MAIGLEVVLTDISTFLLTAAPILGVIIFVLGGIVYGLSFTQPAETRGKRQSTGISMMVGGLIIAAIAGIANELVTRAGGFLTSS